MLKIIRSATFRKKYFGMVIFTFKLFLLFSIDLHVKLFSSNDGESTENDFYDLLLKSADKIDKPFVLSLIKIFNKNIQDHIIQIGSLQTELLRNKIVYEAELLKKEEIFAIELYKREEDFRNQLAKKEETYANELAKRDIEIFHSKGTHNTGLFVQPYDEKSIE
jgi:hypothetical protein